MMKALANRHLSPQRINRLRDYRNRLRIWGLRLLSRSDLLTSIYYGLISSTFRREFRGLVVGMLNFAEEPHAQKQSYFLLRRNIHRLEKGLLMKPRRIIFGLKYISDTVRCYSQLSEVYRSDPNLPSELSWADDVLSAYFGTVESHPIIEQSKQHYLRVRQSKDGIPLLIPYKRNLAQPASVSYQNLLHLSQRRRSVRWFEDKPVERNLIDRAVAVASLSPSACNRQPYEFRIFDDPNITSRVAEIPNGTAGYSHNVPTIVVVVGNLSGYARERDRHIIYIDGGLASMSFMLALETLGLSSCGINWPDIPKKEEEMASLLNLDPHERVVMLIAVGYPDPDGMVASSQKKDLDLIRRYNFE